MATNRITELYTTLKDENVSTLDKTNAIIELMESNTQRLAQMTAGVAKKDKEQPMSDSEFRSYVLEVTELQIETIGLASAMIGGLYEGVAGLAKAFGELDD